MFAAGWHVTKATFFGHHGQVTMAVVSMAAGLAVRLPLADAAEVVLLEEARDGLTLLLLL